MDISQNILPDSIFDNNEKEIESRILELRRKLYSYFKVVRYDPIQIENELNLLFKEHNIKDCICLELIGNMIWNMQKYLSSRPFWDYRLLFLYENMKYLPKEIFARNLIFDYFNCSYSLAMLPAYKIVEMFEYAGRDNLNKLIDSKEKWEKLSNKIKVYRTITGIVKPDDNLFEMLVKNVCWHTRKEESERYSKIKQPIANYILKGYTFEAEINKEDIYFYEYNGIDELIVLNPNKLLNLKCIEVIENPLEIK